MISKKHKMHAQLQQLNMLHLNQGVILNQGVDNYYDAVINKKLSPAGCVLVVGRVMDLVP